MSGVSRDAGTAIDEEGEWQDKSVCVVLGFIVVKRGGKGGCACACGGRRGWGGR